MILEASVDTVWGISVRWVYEEDDILEPNFLHTSLRIKCGYVFIYHNTANML